MIREILPRIWKLNVDSNIYILNMDGELVVIDSGPRTYKEKVKKEIETLFPLDQIKTVIFTHLHYDHFGNYDLFTSAKLYASKQEILDYQKNAYDTVLAHSLDKVQLHPLEQLPKTIADKFTIIETSGHTRGSFCLLEKKNKALFSGDTLFFGNAYGRVDLPTSVPSKMKHSLDTLSKLNYKILCPGHDY